jgi:hypothetical protein
MRRPLRCALVLGASAILACGSAAVGHAQSPTLQANRGVSARNTDHSLVPKRLRTRIRLGDGLRTYYPSLHQLGVSIATDPHDPTAKDAVRYVVNRAVLRRYLLDLAPAVHRAPEDAHPVLLVHNVSDEAEEVPAKIVPGHTGAILEVDAAVDKLQRVIETDPHVQHIVLPVKVIRQAITAQDLAGIDGRIAYFVTHFDPYNRGRTMTVRKAITMVNHTVIAPGQTFSLNKTVGPRDPAHGFTGKSDVFIDGHMAIQNGGGMCQVATTLFNAAMLADLKITERHAHMRTVPYAPPGSDATVYYGEKDLKFTNDTGAPVYIAYRTTFSHAIVALYGKRVPGRKVKIIRHERRLGERHYTGVISRKVYEPDGTVQRGPTFYSNYKWTKALDFNQ